MSLGSHGRTASFGSITDGAPARVSVASRCAAPFFFFPLPTRALPRRRRWPIPSPAEFPLLRATHEAPAREKGPAQGTREHALWGLMSSYLASDVHSIQRQVRARGRAGVGRGDGAGKPRRRRAPPCVSHARNLPACVWRAAGGQPHRVHAGVVAVRL